MTGTHQGWSAGKVSSSVGRRLVVLALAIGLVATAATPAQARSCRPVHNVFSGTRYAGSDLYRIRATWASCWRARRVAYRATRRAIGITPTGPIKRFRWRGWFVTDDLRGPVDRLRARRGRQRVKWLFGDI